MTITVVKQLSKSQIVGAIRRIFARSGKVKEVRRACVCDYEYGPRGGKRYRCAECGLCYPAKETQVDHKDEVVPLNKTLNDMSYDEIIERLDCPIENLQLLCKDCHSKKTKAENVIRRLFKKAKKNYLKRKSL